MICGKHWVTYSGESIFLKRNLFPRLLVLLSFGYVELEKYNIFFDIPEDVWPDRLKHKGCPVTGSKKIDLPNDSIDYLHRWKSGMIVMCSDNNWTGAIRQINTNFLDGERSNR